MPLKRQVFKRKMFKRVARKGNKKMKRRRRVVGRRMERRRRSSSGLFKGQNEDGDDDGTMSDEARAA